MFFFFNDTATTEIYTLSLHDALPIWIQSVEHLAGEPRGDRPPGERAEGDDSDERALEGADVGCDALRDDPESRRVRSEEHTSELQSRQYLVCRLLLEKKKELHHENSR